MPRPSKTGVKGLYRANGRYHIDLRYVDLNTGRGCRHVEHLPFGLSLAAAKERARQLVNHAYAGTVVKSGEGDGPRCLHEGLDLYLAWCEQNRPKTYSDRKHLVRMLKKHLRDVPLAHVDQALLERFKKARAQDGVKPATINRAVAMFKHFLGRAAGEGWISDSVASKARAVTLLKEPPGRVRYLDSEESRRLLAALRPDLRDVVITALLTGMRRGEIIGLRKSAVDLDARLVRLTETKSNKARFVPIHATLLPVLDTAMSRSPCDHVFTNKRGEPHSSHISASFRRAVKRAGIRDLRFHDLRHDFATRLRRSGSGLDLIAALLGHTTLAMTQRYAHLGQEQLAGAVAQLNLDHSPSSHK